MMEPLEVVWQLVTVFAGLIAWVKAISALIIAASLLILPQPHRRTEYTAEGISLVEWLLVMWSRAGVMIGALNMFLSMITSASALGPWGEFIFFPSMALNVSCLIWCRRSAIWAYLKAQRSPEMTVVRSFIAGRKS